MSSQSFKKQLSNEFERILKAHPPISETSPPGAQAGESGMVQLVDSMVTPCSGGDWRGNKETPQSTNTNTKKHKQTKKTQKTKTEHKHKHMDPLVTTPCYQWSGLAERSGRRRGNKETHLSRATARADGEADEYRVQINCWNCREAKW